ncbi:FAD binding domain-containing protein [Ditylenchus destructor]|nr:FAD binding domain-containing protein [Ditylenchus destructor]
MKFADSMDLDAMNHEQHSHTPYLILYIKALEKWRNQQPSDVTMNGDDSLMLPDNFAKRKEFTKVLMSMRKPDNKGSMDEENFNEAKTNLIKSFGSCKISEHVRKVFNDPKAMTYSAQSTATHSNGSLECLRPFWVLAAAVHAFWLRHNQLPVSGVLPDMTSDSARYTQLLQIYKLFDPHLPLPSKYLLDFEVEKSNSSMGSSAPSDFSPLQVLSNKRLTTEDHFQDTRLISFSLESTEDAESRFKYKPGDVLNVYPYNLQHSVNMAILALEACKNRLDVPFGIQPAEENIPPPPTWLFSGQSTTLRTCLERYFDLQMIPRRSFLAMLSKFARDPMEKDRLQELASPQGLDDYLDYCQRPRRTVAELLRDFPATSASLAPQQLFDVMSAIRPRAFSIASSPASTPPVIQLLVARVVYKVRRMAESRRGICSNFLCDLTSGDKVFAKIRLGTFTYNSASPLLLVGPGTGVAPFRSIIHTNERISGNSVKILLFFGCRNSSKDFYFEDDWKECKHLTLATAFSRDQPEKFYVQHAIVQNEHVWEYLRNPNAKILIAGSANEMPKEVIKALKKIAESNGIEKVDDFFEELEKMNRIQFETWS